MSLDFSQNGYEDMFKRALVQGINLFCGAGFSVEACDKEGRKLPVGAGLLDELKERFPVIKDYTTLPRACTKITKTDRQSFYSFLEKRFTVGEFDSEYLALLGINIKNIYTTNIDDLFFRIYEKSEQPFYLYDCSTKGVSYNDEMAVHYYPLHGCVRNEKNYVFGATEIASAFSQRGNERSWKSLAVDSAKHPILFWGWNFDDAGPIQAMYGDDSNRIEDNVDRWVLLRNPTAEMIDYIESLRFNIIIGDTADMLEYLSDFCIASVGSEEEIVVDAEKNKLLEAYRIPQNDSMLTAYPLKKFFLEYTPRWSHIYSRNIPKTSNYRKVANSIASGKNTIVMGIRGSGKTTLMMQLLVDYESSRQKHLLIGPSIDQVNHYIRLLDGQKTLLFVDDCFRDTNAIIQLFRTSNIQVVCFDRDFNYERQYHKISPYQFNLIDVTEITQEDAQSIVDIIPVELRRINAGTRNVEKDPTILNLLAMNLREMDFRFMIRFYEKDAIAAKVFLMISYVHSCGTPCSFDMVYSFLGDEKYSWEEMFEILNRAGGLIRDVSDWQDYDILEGLQNYYECRSRFLAEKMIASIPRQSTMFGEVLNEFTKYVPAFKICSYDKFKRSAYDADLAERAFQRIEDGKAFYELCVGKDESEYVYQQAAIYFSRMGDYRSAFEWIEKARNLAHYNRFSIDSTYAKIYFDVNLKANREQAETALEIMSDCCKNDKRKSIHFANFARCCLDYYDEYSDDKYLYLALQYIEEGLDDQNLSLSQKNKQELENLKERLKKRLSE